jgi:hypothetical protein
MIFVCIQYFKYSNGRDIFFELICECSCLIHTKIAWFYPKLYHDNCVDLVKMEIACTSYEDITNKKDTSFV